MAYLPNMSLAFSQKAKPQFPFLSYTFVDVTLENKKKKKREREGFLHQKREGKSSDGTSLFPSLTFA